MLFNSNSTKFIPRTSLPEADGKMINTRRFSATAVLLVASAFAFYLWHYTGHKSSLRVESLKEPFIHSESPADHQDTKAEDTLSHGTGLFPTASETNTFRWSQVQQHYPLSSFSPLPSGNVNSLPRIQHEFSGESDRSRHIRTTRLNAVLGNFTKSWQGYKQHAWLKDEVGPLSGKSYDHFGGWAASLVDSLDTLWIMGLEEEFAEAIDAIRSIDFSTCALSELNVFETTIRYMGGLLGAYDISNGSYPVLLEKAKELGEMVYKAFDTPNRMPITRWDFQSAKAGVRQEAPDGMLVAEIGSLSLELTRLSQLTGDERYYDAIKRITDQFQLQQQHTRLPGLFPLVVNARDMDFKTGDMFTLGGMVDSLYEYLPKTHLLLQGGTSQYQELYLRALQTMSDHIIYRPMTRDERDIRIAGQVNTASGTLETEPQSQHLTCFTGGMVGLGSRAFGQSDMMRLAEQLTGGCTWAYEIMPRGIQPEIMHTVRCESQHECPWSTSAWHEMVDSMNNDEGLRVADKVNAHHLPEGVASIDDTRYGLRPEAIESVFVLYRLTGDKSLQETAWRMFNDIITATETKIGAAALDNCVDPSIDGRTDRMESFWLAETLKYFYLIFAEPDVVSLDEFVLNTEAHPFRYRKL